MIDKEEGLCLEEAVAAFDFGGVVVGTARYGSGHINDTFAVYIQLPNGDAVRYILQRINSDIFKKPQQVMANIVGVTEYLRNIIEKTGGDPERETLNVVKTKTYGNYFVDSNNKFWRCFNFIEDTICLQKVEKPEHFYASAKSFGNFMRQLENYPADTLFETIERFHDTPHRFANFTKALKEDKMGRAKDVQREIDFVLAREEDCRYLINKLEKKELPLRVTHNDTKLNNILLDANTGGGLCIIDLDTIMPGLSVTDFGDSIRFGATTAEEDEPDTDKMHFSLPLYELYTKGYLEATGPALTQEEKRCLPWGAKLMTLECGIRFLTDYLEGDIYFKIHREKHNLDRARTQFKLVDEMEQNWQKMHDIVSKYSI